ncbi:MAG: DUF1360 domain-containing protein [Gaiellaceae bacterium]
MTSRRFGVRFAIASLAAWRITHLLAEEDGPAGAMVRVRARAGESWVGELLDCFYCVSIWVAAPIAVATAPRRRDIPVNWLALSGAACLLERATGAAASSEI